VLACFVVGPAAAQTREREPGIDGPEHFGEATGTTTVPAVAFFYYSTVDDDGFRYLEYDPLGSSTSGMAPLGLPNGAVITQLCAVVVDAEMTCGGATRLDLIGYEYPAYDGDPPTPSAILATTGTGSWEAPGYTMVCTTPPSPIRVRSVGDLDGDADWGRTGYALKATVSWPRCGGSPRVAPEAPTGLGFGAAVIHWRRTVSPAPKTASFSDVPKSTGIFRYVEALAASGITGGCGGGRFCPDKAVTRGQMAVFLATALGLHWPN
jgi:hypothetical protein